MARKQTRYEYRKLLLISRELFRSSRNGNKMCRVHLRRLTNPLFSQWRTNRLLGKETERNKKGSYTLLLSMHSSVLFTNFGLLLTINVDCRYLSFCFLTTHVSTKLFRGSPVTLLDRFSARCTFFDWQLTWP